MHGLPRSLAALTIAAALGTGGCGRQPPTPAADPPAAPAPAATGREVREITLGNASGADTAGTLPLTTFGPRATISASVATEGAPATATLAARWTFLGGSRPSLVDSTAQTITPTGPAATEFHVSKPDGWPAGAYRVEIFADGRLIGTREFEVR